MSKTVSITSPAQLDALLHMSTIVVIDFYADWCGPCKVIAPLYEQLSAQLTRHKRITFTKVNVDQQSEIAQRYEVTSMPTFLIFKDREIVSRIRGADSRQLSEAVRKLAAEAESAEIAGQSSGFSSGSSRGTWMGASLPRGYSDVTDQVDLKGLDLLNFDNALGNARTLFDSKKPSASPTSDKGKGKASENDSNPDWVESDTDEQLMLFIPFQATLKVHTLHITSFAPSNVDEDDDETPMRPKTLKLFTNRSHVLSFDEAEETSATQVIELSPKDWDEESATAKVELRFVKFQNVSSLVLFVADGDGGREKTRIDRLRIVGETGEKREMGKLEKIGDEPGE